MLLGIRLHIPKCPQYVLGHAKAMFMLSDILGDKLCHQSVNMVSESHSLPVCFFEMQDIILIKSTFRHYYSQGRLQIAAMNVSQVWQ